MIVLNWLRFIFPKIFGVKSQKICELPPSGHFLCPRDITIRLVSETTISLKPHRNWIFWRGKLYRFSETMKQSKPTTPSGAIPCWAPEVEVLLPNWWGRSFDTVFFCLDLIFMGNLLGHTPPMRHPPFSPKKNQTFYFSGFSQQPSSRKTFRARGKGRLFPWGPR